MITRIVLNNFMAHKHTVLELGPGVTALTGPNNTGKSAIVEALRCVATNPTPKHYIRHGAKQASVEVELEDGVRVVWIRKKLSAGYEIHYPDRDEPEEYWKLGRSGVPEDVRKLLRLDNVELETGQSIDVHLGNQREPVFLLNETGSAVAAFFAASTEGSHLLAMQDRLKDRTREAKRTEADTLKRVSQVRSDLDKLAPLPECNLLMETARELESQNTRNEQQMSRLAEMLETRDRIDNSLEYLNKGATTLAAVTEPPALADTNTPRQVLQQLSSLDRQLDFAQKTSESLVPLQSPPETAPTRPLEAVLGQLQSLAVHLNTQQAQAESLAPLATPPELQPVSGLSAMLLQSRQISSQLDSLCAQRDKLELPEEAPQLTDCGSLQTLVRDMDRMTRDMGTLKSRLDAETKQISRFEMHVSERLKTIGACPICGHDMDMEHFFHETDVEAGHDA